VSVADLSSRFIPCCPHQLIVAAHNARGRDEICGNKLDCSPRRVPSIKRPVSKDVALQLLAIGIGIQAGLIDRMNVVAVFALEKADF
jgi:hypothetical protein